MTIGISQQTKNFLVSSAQLMRTDRPIGTVLLACPMLWALWLSADGQPPASVVLVFLFGAFLMRRLRGKLQAKPHWFYLLFLFYLPCLCYYFYR